MLFSKPARDPVFAYDATGTIEDLQAYWHRAVRITYDTSTELIEVRVSRLHARRRTEPLQQASSRKARFWWMSLSAIAQEDTIAFAKDELARAVERLKVAREAMTAFRSRTQIVDPTADFRGKWGFCRRWNSNWPRH